MSGGRSRERTVGLVSLAVLGVGFVAMAAGVDYFWMAWVLGYAVVVPAVSMLLGDDTDENGETDADDDPVETLRKRYARGELTDREFERRLKRVLETEGDEGSGRADEGVEPTDLGELDAQVETGGEREQER